jgi:Ca2+-binding EF-hand superfamily protein
VVSTKTPYAKKADIVFRAFDADESGTISPQQAVAVLKQLIGNTLAEEHIVSIVKAAFGKVGTDQGGHITKQVFQEVVIGEDLEAQMTVEITA